jgi:hypothetical protein
MKTLAEREAERKAWLTTLEPKMVEILEGALLDRRPIAGAELRAAVEAAVKADRAKHPRRKLTRV